MLSAPAVGSPQLVMVLVFWLGNERRFVTGFLGSPRTAPNPGGVGWALPASAQARLCRTAGPPFQRQGARNRAKALECTGSWSAACAHVFPPSAETITREMRPLPE